MPSRRMGGGGTTRRKHSLGNLRRAHPASGATWNVQVVRGKMSSKCLWHACRALVLGLTLLLLGAGMATIGYYADYLSMGSELRGNATVRVKNDLKGFHLNNFSYVGPIVMGFGGFIVVASCVMTFEARDSAAKVVPARLRPVGNSKTTVRSNQSSAASQRRAAGVQLQATRWDQHFGVFRSSPATEIPQSTPAPLDREALTAELVKFSKSLSASARFSPQLRRLTLTGSVPNLSTHAIHPLAYSTNISHLLSPKHKSLLLMEHKRFRHSHHRHHHHHHQHHNHHYNNHQNRPNSNNNNNNSGRQIKNRGTRISNSLIQRTTRESTGSMACTLLQPPSNKLYWHAASFDESARSDKQLARMAERTKRSDTAKRHVLARQKPIEQEEDRSCASPLTNRRNSIMSDSSYSGRWTARCTSIASRASSIDSRRIQVDLHSPEVMPKSILRSPKRYSSGPSNNSSVEREFRSQLSVCSEPPAAIRQLSGQSSLEPCLPEEVIETTDEKTQVNLSDSSKSPVSPSTPENTEPSPIKSDSKISNRFDILKKPRPDSLPLTSSATILNFPKSQHEFNNKLLQRSNSTRTFYRPKPQISPRHDDSIFYIRSLEQRDTYDWYDSEQVINERRYTLLKADSETALTERKQSTFSIPERINENSHHTSVDIDIEDVTTTLVTNNETVLQIEIEIQGNEQKNSVVKVSENI
uniref:Transmembrane protein 200A n=1 Tax=Glossina brevipalpis TaxID=37001 RepID=A0A1A9W3B4_9MUSC